MWSTQFRACLCDLTQSHRSPEGVLPCPHFIVEAKRGLGQVHTGLPNIQVRTRSQGCYFAEQVPSLIWDHQMTPDKPYTGSFQVSE